MQSQQSPQTPIQTMRPQDGSKASAKSLPLHLLNGPHAKWAIDMTEATNIKNIQHNFARSGVYLVCSKVVNWMTTAQM